MSELSPDNRPPSPEASVLAGRRTSSLRFVAIGVGVAVFMLVASLAITLLPAMARARESARRTTCLSNLEQLGLGIKTYSHDFSDVYPWYEGVSDPTRAWRDPWCHLGMLYPSYCSAPKSFFCPSSRDRAFAFELVGEDKHGNPIYAFPSDDRRRVISYSYSFDTRGGKPKAWTTSAQSTVRLLADKKAGFEIKREEIARANHKDLGRNVLYQDGHVNWKDGPMAVDPDEDDNDIGKRFAPDYREWWSDPPYYGESHRK